MTGPRKRGVVRRECGCEREIIPVAEQPERVRRAGRGSPVARFIHRCPSHKPMCRGFEPWELELLTEAEAR